MGGHYRPVLPSIHRLRWRLDRPPAGWAPEDAVGGFSPSPAGIAARLGAAGPELVVFVTTHRRPAAMARTGAQLDAAIRAGRAAGCLERFAVVVVDDASPDPMHDSVAEDWRARFGDALHMIRTTERAGKHGFWRTHHLFQRLARSAKPRHALFLQDDLHFEPSLLVDCYRIWPAIGDPAQRVLYLLRLSDDERWGRWVWFRRRPGPIPEVDRVGWFDLAAFFVDRSFFEQLGYAVYPVPARRWRLSPSVSSGVGEQLTLRLHRRVNIYQVKRSLVRTGGEPSAMNAEARARRPLSNLGA